MNHNDETATVTLKRTNELSLQDEAVVQMESQDSTDAFVVTVKTK